MRKLSGFVLVPILLALTVLLQVQAVDKWLNGLHRNADLIIGISLALATVALYCLEIWPPFAKYLKLENRRWKMFKILIREFKNGFFPHNELKVNIMVTKRRIFYRNRLFPAKTFKLVWAYKPPNRLLLDMTVDQGVTGLAYKYGTPQFFDFKKDDIKRLNLNPEQEEILSHLEFMISCPIFKMDKNDEFTEEILGFLNVSCSLPKSRMLIDSDDKLRVFKDTIVEVAEMCSLII